MSDKQNTMTPADEMALMVEGLYKSVNGDLQKVKKEILNELQYSSVQTSSLYDSMKKDSESAAESAAMKSADCIANEMKYVYQQNQAIYEDLADVFDARISKMEEKLAALDKLDEALKELSAKIEGADFDAVAEELKEKVLESIPVYDEIDYDKVADAVNEKTEEQAQQVLNAVAGIPVAENVDYSRIVEEVGDRVLDILREEKAAQEAEQAEALLAEEETEEETEEEPTEEVQEELPLDYDRLIYGTAEKVIESLPQPEKVDYEAVAEIIMSKLAKEDDYAYEVVIDGDNVDKIVDGITESMDMEALSEKIADKVAVPETIVPEIDYAAFADAVAERIVVPQAPVMEIDYERLADLVISKMAQPEIDYDRLATLVAEKIAPPTQVEEKYDILVTEEGIDAIAEKVAEKLDLSNVQIELLAEEPVEIVEEPVEEVVEEPVEEVVEEPVEEVVEEPVEEVKEEPAKEEVAVASAPTYVVDGNELVDAETGLVVRLKRSFTAKMKQSEDSVKAYYSAVKNELLSYEKVNSHVSWHGDRFNLGRETVAKINICGKTLGLYLNLDPQDPEFKQTVYHQKDVSGQKAYDGTPFMVKIKSDAALKKAVRLIEAMAVKMETQKDAEFTAVDYVEEFAFETTEKLIEDGLIRQTKEKKVDLDF